ncbi:isoleucine--tRNA ligase, partial [Candidatus Dependentiae bacterium]|nr:isoleucine--tRNA ligase [Candidatus Dependentiae bacterium]
PYANGNIHLGTTLNKCLKDFVTKSKRMAGYHVPFVLGWDCHGLPIEFKMMKELGIEQSSAVTDRVAFKKLCRDYANKWIEVQRSEFKDLGVVADWTKPYITMDPAYEAEILRSFATFIAKGYIERKGKTVPWCASCQTVLAGAEIEYKERKDPSCYILFALEDAAARKTFPFVFEKNPNLTINTLIWTTTPWTIPLNRAVVLHPEAVYVVLQGRTPNEAFIVAKELADKICQTLELPRIELAEFDSVVLKGKPLHHPLDSALLVPVILDETVALTDGTACVHSAPGCGPEDYLMGLKNNLEIYSPLSVDGKYIKGINPQELEGMSITDGQWWVLKQLTESDRLMKKDSIKHSYPHCWRCRNGLMFRATDQWFCSLQKNNIVKQAVDATEQINFVPDWGKNRLQAFVQTRSEWCISRQRHWGTPIPALACGDCGNAYLNDSFVMKVADHVEKEGIEFWDRMSGPELARLGLLDKDFACSSCRNKDLTRFILERDILDVWFDSGVSSYAVLRKDERLRFPADMYLEGSDQHRGWFQSSLFCSLIVNDAPYATSILTHGYVVDEKKMKMSKSVGNVIAPQDIIKKYSRDILRLWVASSAYENDIVISDKLLENLAEVYRKIRNTCRFMISNLYDFDVNKDAVGYENLWALDQYILGKFYQLDEEIQKEYALFHFSAVVQLMNNFCTNDLSSEYLDILKDRLYCEEPTSKARRSAQTVMYTILDQLTHLMAPLLSFLAEEVSDHYMKDKKESIHLRIIPMLENVWDMVTHETGVHQDLVGLTVPLIMERAWQGLQQMRTVVLKELEMLRQQGIIRQSMEAKVSLYIEEIGEQGEALKFLFDYVEKREGLHRFLQDWFIVSAVTLKKDKVSLKATDASWIYVDACKAEGEKCPRCWQWRTKVDTRGLCNRCASAIIG